MPTELRKALESTGSGSNLIRQDLEPVVRDMLYTKSPLLNLFPKVNAVGSVHTIAKRTVGIGASFEGEMASPTYANSTYARRNVTIKIVRGASQVSNFQRSAAMSFTDSLEREIESAVEGFRETSEFLSLWGVSDDSDIGFTGDAFQYSGIYPWIIADAQATNIIDMDATVNLNTTLDAMLDATMFKYQNLQGGKWLFMASPAMISKIGSLQTLIRRNVERVEFEGGFTMDTYRGVPIMPSGFVAPTSTSVSVTGLSASAGGTGSVTGTYRYKVAAITLYGEQVASATAACVLSSNTTATLTWTATTGAKSYAIYRTGAGEADDDDNYDLIDVISAFTYASGVPTANASPSYADTFAKTAKTNVHPLGSGEECIFLAYLDQNHGAALAVLPPVLGDALGGDPTKNLIRFQEISANTSSFQFRLESFHALQIPDASTCAVARRVAKV